QGKLAERERRVRQVVAQLGAIRGAGGALVGGRRSIVRALVGGCRDCVGQRDRELRCRGAVQRRGVDGSGRADSTTQLKRSDPQRRFLLQLRYLGAGQLEAE